MNMRPLFALAWLVPALVSAHSWKAGESLVFDEALRAHLLDEWRQHGDKQSATPQFAANDTPPKLSQAPAQAAPFVAFAPKVEVKWDKDFLYIESNGLPSHNMMVGITAWQQQVPLPQSYRGDNAWRLPLKPVPAKTPAVVENHFLRGAIAIAANGIPIFNPQNNRGEVSYEIGELDQWGGHCGRADDYHYHIAPLHLQSVVGKNMPIAYALDGYPIYGLTEPDGAPVGQLDECHGHEDTKYGYHYHASTKRPYVQSAFHGEVVEAEGQVDPQPRANPVRPALQALRGAAITGFESTGQDSYKLSYTVQGDKRSIAYTIKADGTYPFTFDNGSDGVVSETYSARQGGGGPPRRPDGPEGKGKGKGKGGPGSGMRRNEEPPPRPEGEQQARPPRPQSAVQGILDANGDGLVTAQEFAENAKANATKSGASIVDAMAKAKEQFNTFDHNRDGKLDTPELDELAGNAPTSGEPPPPRGERPPERGEMERGGGRDRGRKQEAFVALPDQPRSSDGKFMLHSPVVADLKSLPIEFTGDGEGISPPLEWTGAPPATQAYALIMDHVAPGGERKWYWTIYDIPASVTNLPKNSQDIGKIGTGFKGNVGYEPPHSKGPGTKTYVITLYALSSPLDVTPPPAEVGREVLLAAMKGKILATSSLRVTHTSAGSGTEGGERPRPPRR
ncbi:MAG: YHYH protein [Roseimicrobium sp.]